PARGGPGPGGGRSGGSGGRSEPAPPRRRATRSAPDSCGSAGPVYWPAPPPTRWNSATSSKQASAGCPPPSGPGACGPAPGTPAPQAWSCADMPARRAAGPALPPARDAGRRTAATSPGGGGAGCPGRAPGRAASATLLLPALRADHGLRGGDAALAPELASGTLRGGGTYDAVLAACSPRALADIDPPLLDVLRL